MHPCIEFLAFSKIASTRSHNATVVTVYSDLAVGYSVFFSTTRRSDSSSWAMEVEIYKLTWVFFLNKKKTQYMFWARGIDPGDNIPCFKCNWLYSIVVWSLFVRYFSSQTIAWAMEYLLSHILQQARVQTVACDSQPTYIVCHSLLQTYPQLTSIVLENFKIVPRSDIGVVLPLVRLFCLHNATALDNTTAVQTYGA